jgi:hypothetical protein
MTKPNPKVALSLRLYRALSRAFPFEFKSSYQDELLPVMEDGIESSGHRTRTGGGLGRRTYPLLVSLLSGSCGQCQYFRPGIARGCPTLVG